MSNIMGRQITLFMQAEEPSALLDRVKAALADDARWLVPRRYREVGQSILGDRSRLRKAMSKIIHGVSVCRGMALSYNISM